MGSPTRLPGDLYVPGQLVCGGLVLPNQSVGNQNINPAQPIAAQNLVMEYNKTFAQDHGTAATAERKVIHVANAAGTWLNIACGVTQANSGGATITVDFYLNGSSILATPTVISTDAAFSVRVGAFNSGDLNYVANNVFEVVVTVTPGSGTLGQGLWVEVAMQESTL